MEECWQFVFWKDRINFTRQPGREDVRSGQQLSIDYTPQIYTNTLLEVAFDPSAQISAIPRIVHRVVHAIPDILCLVFVRMQWAKRRRALIQQQKSNRWPTATASTCCTCWTWCWQKKSSCKVSQTYSRNGAVGRLHVLTYRPRATTRKIFCSSTASSARRSVLRHTFRMVPCTRTCW